MAIYTDTSDFARADWEAARADIMARYTAGAQRDALIEAARNAYGSRITRAFDAENIADAFSIYAGKNVYDTDTKTYSYADPSNGYRPGYSAFPVYVEAGAIIVQELGADGRLHPVARRVVVEA